MAQRFSHQRERIYQTVLERRDHPTAEMVYQQLKPEMPRLSLGTVYRNLQQMGFWKKQIKSARNFLCQAPGSAI